MKEEGSSQIFVDGLHAIGSHNGVVRVEFFSLNAAGEPSKNVAIQIPMQQVKNLVEGLIQTAKLR